MQSQSIEKLSLRRWRYDIPRFASTRKPPSAFSATGKPDDDDDDLYEMEFSTLYGRYRSRGLGYDDAMRRSRNRWNTPDQTEEHLRLAEECKRQREHLEHILRAFHFMQWVQQLQREEMQRQHQRQQQLEHSRSRSRGMER